MVLYHAFGFFE